jgi:3-methyladenine DNA glycosylase AlkD
MARKSREGNRPEGGDILSALREELEQRVDERAKAGTQRFFREKVTCYGVKTPVVQEIARRYFRALEGRSKEEIFALCEALYRTDTCEEAYIAAEWAYRVRDRYVSGDFSVFGEWIAKYVNNWAKCDTLCNHAVGSLVERFPGHLADLKSWTGSGNRWVRRASAVTLVLPARKGMFLEDIFDISGRLLSDGDDLVQKGYGWLLKEASKAHPEEVFRFVMDHRKHMPRTALRYAIEKIPAEWRKRAMEK